jgi:hypothetical protein
LRIRARSEQNNAAKIAEEALGHPQSAKERNVIAEIYHDSILAYTFQAFCEILINKAAGYGANPHGLLGRLDRRDCGRLTTNRVARAPENIVG